MFDLICRTNQINIIIMEQLRLNNTAITLVDHVEDRVLSYLSEHDFKLGDKLPSEHELAVSLGVTRSVVREALSRLKMLGIVESRTRRGMVLKEPSIFGGDEACDTTESDEREVTCKSFGFPSGT